VRRLQRLRGLLGLSIASAVAWIPLGAVLVWIESMLVGRSIAFKYVIADMPEFAAVGAFCGFAFGLALAAAGRSRPFDSLRLGRFVALGFTSALVIPVVAILFNLGSFTVRGLALSLGIFGVPGALTAGALLLIARRAPSDRVRDRADSNSGFVNCAAQPGVDADERG
jgi:hypothetical protein